MATKTVNKKEAAVKASATDKAVTSSKTVEASKTAIASKETAASKAIASKAAAPTEKAAEKKATVKKPAEKKPTVKKEIKVKSVVEYFGKQVEDKDMVAAVKKAWTKKGKKIGDIKTIELYIKPEEGAVYYVVNGIDTGAVAF